MKKGLIIIGIIAVVVLILYSFFAGRFNKLFELQDAIPNQWMQLETQYQLNVDLWKQVTMEGSLEAMNYIVEHCIIDVDVLEQVYNRVSQFVSRINSWGSA